MVSNDERTVLNMHELINLSIGLFINNMLIFKVSC